MNGDLFNTTTKSGIVLRPYQEECIEAVSSAFKNHQSSLVVMATGLGKTVTAGEILRLRGGRSMWVAHRSELVEQAEETIGWLTGVPPQVEMADRQAQIKLGVAGCVVGTVQTLNAKRRGVPRMARFDANFFNTLITDEAHHAVASTWRSIAEHFSENTRLRHLGITATPDRGDEEALGQIYDHCAYRYDIQDGVADGWLVPILVNRIHLDDIDLSVIKKVAGDFNQGELAHAMEMDRAMYGVSEAILEEAGERKTLIFTSSVAHSKGLADILNNHKPGMAASVDGKTPKDERRLILADYKAGNIQYLCNVGIATEGFDAPGIECIAIARPTMSRSLYAQMVGRGTRPLPDIVDGLGLSDRRCDAILSSRKPNCVVLDFVGNSGKHKLVSAADVLGGNYNMDVVERANEMAEKTDSPEDTLELLKRAEAAVRKDEEELKKKKMRRAVRASVKYRTASMNPFDVLDIEPPLSHEEIDAKPLSPGQIGWLEKSGMDTEMMSNAEQRKVLNTMINRKKRGLATPKQVKLLKRYNYNTTNMLFEDASALITRLADNNWKRV
mgnify:FL=1